MAGDDALSGDQSNSCAAAVELGQDSGLLWPSIVYLSGRGPRAAAPSHAPVQGAQSPRVAFPGWRGGGRFRAEKRQEMWFPVQGHTAFRSPPAAATSLLLSSKKAGSAHPAASRNCLLPASPAHPEETSWSDTAHAWLPRCSWLHTTDSPKPEAQVEKPHPENGPHVSGSGLGSSSPS